MYWIWQFITSHRNAASLIVTILLSFFMITSGKQKQQNIAKTLTMTVFSPAQLVVGSFYQFNNILNENKKLREKIVSVELENSVLRGKLDEMSSADTLENQIEILPGYEILPASIVAREPSFFYRTAIINIGANHGLKNSMPVISDGGIVGKVISVLPLTSQIQMIYAPEEYISIEHGRTGAFGILESKTDGSLFVNLRNIAEVEIGDTLFTTGLGGIYPRGLKVGRIENIEIPKNGDVFKKIHIKSGVDFEKIRKVFIVKSDSQWESIKEEIVIIKDGEN
jgi:rod shape-determining protein MreC